MDLLNITKPIVPVTTFFIQTVNRSGSFPAGIFSSKQPSLLDHVASTAAGASPAKFGMYPEDHDIAARDWFDPPLGANLRGGI